MKRSRRVVLTMMGTAAVGAVSMGLTPRRHCGPGRARCPASTAGPIAAADLWRLRRHAASRPRSWPCRPRPCRRRRRITFHTCSASPAPSATTGATTAEACGFDFHTIDGERYWDERAYYAFTLEEIERRDRGADRRDRRDVPRARRPRRSTTRNICERLKIPEAFWPLISESWKRDEASLYGRLDLCFDGQGPAKLLEYNADTPTSIFEAAVFQWTWLEQAIERRIIPKRADQFNSIHERLIEGWKKLGARPPSASRRHDRQRRGCAARWPISRTPRAQAGLATTLIDIEDIGWRDDGGFVDLDDRAIELAFKLYPWEWMFRDAFGARLAEAPTRWIEPPWKAVLSNKGILPLLWEMFPGHPNLLPAYFEDDPSARASSARPMCASRSIRARAPMSR